MVKTPAERGFRYIPVKEDVYNELVKLKEELGVEWSDLFRYLIGGAYSRLDVVDAVMNEVAEYVKSQYSASADDVKLVRYVGGDHAIFDKLNSIFVRAAGASTFVEVFGGSCWCSLNVPRSKFKVIVCNDIDRDLINLYTLVKTNPDLLIKRLSILPYSEELLRIATSVLSSRAYDHVTKAMMLFYVTRVSYFSKTWSTSFGRSKTRNHARSLSRAIAAIADYAKRFRDVALECRDFREVLRLYDSESTLFYMDPPYVSAEAKRSSYYRYGFTVKDLHDLATALGAVKGYWVLKIADDNYELIKSRLPPHEVTMIEKAFDVGPEDTERRKVVRYVVAYNYTAKTLHSKASSGR